MTRLGYPRRKYLTNRKANGTIGKAERLMIEMVRLTA